MHKYGPFGLGDGAKKPYKKYTGDAGWDLFVSRPCDIAPGQTVDIHTDIKIAMPAKMYARIVGRSSTLRKYKLLVNEAIIDNGYTGEMFICVHNMGDKTFHVEQGMRLAQMIFGCIEDIHWSEVEEIKPDPKKRGNYGFGSTGV